MSKQKNDGGPAFPQFEVVAGERNGHGDIIDAYTTATGGMSLRDWFAGQAMQGIYSSMDGGIANTSMGALLNDAEIFYRIADAMLAERAKS